MNTRRRDIRGKIDLPAPEEPFRDLIGGHLSLDFANTVDEHGENSSHDYLFPGFGNLVSWALYAGVVDEAAAGRLARLAKREPREAVQVRRRAVALREAIRALATGTAQDDHIRAIETEWHLAASHRRLALVKERRQLAWEWADDNDLDRLLWPIVASAVDLFSGDMLNRVRQCEAPGCGQVFLDTTRNGSRRFCRPQGCGNRTRVRRFRETQAHEHEQQDLEPDGE